MWLPCQPMMGTRHWQQTSWLAIFLLVMNVAAGLTLPTPAHGDDGALCTQLGIVSPVAGDDGFAHNGQPAKTQICSFCMPLLHGGLDHATHGPLLNDPIHMVGAAELAPLQQPFAATPINSRNQLTRAPPSVVV